MQVNQLSFELTLQFFYIQGESAKINSTFKFKLNFKLNSILNLIQDPSFLFIYVLLIIYLLYIILIMY